MKRRLVRHRRLLFLIGSCVLLMTGEALWLRYNVQVARMATASVQRQRKELRALEKFEPSLTAGTLTQARDEKTRRAAVLQDLQKQLIAQDDDDDTMDSAATSAHGAESFFDIATFVERMRARAASLGVQVLPDERFGFAEYAHVIPASEDIPQVMRQRSAIEYLLETLFQARPHSLIAIQRERAAHDPVQRTSLEPSGRVSSIRDYFAWDRGGSVAMPPLVNAIALRVSFVAQTVTLRTFLNRLAEFERPLVVREVEVEPVTPAAAKNRIADDSEKPAPLVAKSLSRFVVTVELISLFGVDLYASAP